MNPLLPPELFWPLMLVLLGLVWRTRRAVCGKLEHPWRWIALVLRLATVACLGILLLNPGHYAPVDAGREGTGWVLLDRSASMGLRAGDKTDSRFALALARLGETEDKAGPRVRVLPFAENVEAETSVGAAADLKADGEGTDLLGAVAASLDLALGDASPARGILVLTDGIHLGSADAVGALALRARAHRVPISAIVLGEAGKRPDLELLPARDLLTMVAGGDRGVRGRIVSRHLPATRKTLTLRDESGKVLDEAKMDLAADATTAFALRTGPLPEGRHRLVLELEGDSLDILPDNNRREIQVHARDVRLRVLLLEGIPHWDSKFLAQWLRSQKGIELTTFHRLAENRFFRVDPANPLPQGGESRRPPDEENDFRHFDVILVGRGLDYFGSGQTAGALHRFVRDHGGVLVFTRGRPVTSDQPGLEALVPLAWLDERADDRRARPSRAGVSSGLFGDLLPDAGDPRWDSLPPLRGLRRARLSDGLATVLLQGESANAPGDPWPVMVTRRQGNGRVLALNGEGMWHWDFQPGGEDPREWYQEFWSQVLLWSTQASRFQPGQDFRVEASPEDLRAGDDISFEVEQRLEDEAVRQPRLRVQAADGSFQDLPLHAAGGERQWRTRWTAPAPGVFALSVQTETEATGPTLLLLRVPPPPGELDDLDPRENPLRQLVEQSGGRWITDESAALAFAGGDAPQGPTGDAEWRPHWTRAWVFLLMLALPACEWGLRRRKGLI